LTSREIESEDEETNNALRRLAGCRMDSQIRRFGTIFLKSSHCLVLISYEKLDVPEYF